MTKSKTASGFTIVEVLVVIAILIVLAAIGFSSLRRAGQAANGARCVSNIRQICADHIILANESGGFLSHPYRSAPMNGPMRNWNRLHTILQSSTLGWRSPVREIDKEMRTMSHLQCPVAYSLRRSEMDANATWRGWGTYMLNGLIGIDGKPEPGSRGWIVGAATLPQVVDPTKLVLVSERTWNGNNYPSAGGPGQGPDRYAKFHAGGFHVGYFDGHVEKVSKPETFWFAKVTNNGQPGKWSSPEYSLKWRGVRTPRPKP